MQHLRPHPPLLTLTDPFPSPAGVPTGHVPGGTARCEQGAKSGGKLGIKMGQKRSVGQLVM